MDRFIDNHQQKNPLPFLDLKSNMDRFIVRTINNLIAEKFDLKSNMDRFIDLLII